MLNLQNPDRVDKTKRDFIKEFQPEFMLRAIELSKTASMVEKCGGVFGAVIVKEGKIISEGYNQVIKQNDPTWHAEMQAIRGASKKLKSPHLIGCVLYTNAECCPMCFAASYWAHLDHIYYASTIEDAKKYGGFQDIDIFEEIGKDPKERKIRSSEHMRKDAVEIWKEFSKMPGRAKY